MLAPPAIHVTRRTWYTTAPSAPRRIVPRGHAQPCLPAPHSARCGDDREALHHLPRSEAFSRPADRPLRPQNEERTRQPRARARTEGPGMKAIREDGASRYWVTCEISPRYMSPRYVAETFRREMHRRDDDLQHCDDGADGGADRDEQPREPDAPRRAACPQLGELRASIRGK